MHWWERHLSSTIGLNLLTYICLSQQSLLDLLLVSKWICISIIHLLTTGTVKAGVCVHVCDFKFVKMTTLQPCPFNAFHFHSASSPTHLWLPAMTGNQGCQILLRRLAPFSLPHSCLNLESHLLSDSICVCLHVGSSQHVCVCFFQLTLNASKYTYSFTLS